MWEKAVHAGLFHRWIKNNLGLPVFVCHFVVVFDGYAAKGLTLHCQTILKHAIVRTVGDSQQAHTTHQQSQRDSPEPGFGFVGFYCGHGLDYTRRRTGPGSGALTILHKNLPPLCSSTRQNGRERNDKMHQKGRGRTVPAPASFLGMCVSASPLRVRSFSFLLRAFPRRI